LNGLLAALQFLSVLPIHRKFEADDIGRSLVWFPVAGLFIGLCSAMVYGVTRMFCFPAIVSALAGVMALAGFSGFLHLDGVADTADGFLSSRPRERILEIMRDTRIGTMGVIGVFCVLAFKWAALLSLPPAIGWRILVLAPIVGRAGQIITMHYMPYARLEGGLASVFLAHCSRQTVLIAIFACILAAAVLGGGRGIMALCVSGIFGFYFNFRCLRKIGGMTGDTLGAISEGIETVVMCAMCVGMEGR
jgi:adenosylcobinamide-GDP ribazoletransferase